jgi:hypothetical protein
MTEKQEKKVAVQKAVMEVMETHNSRWQSVPEMKKNYDIFVRNLKKIDDHIEVLRTDPDPLKKDRLHSRQALIDQLFPVISVLGVYAFDRGDSKLGKFVRMKFSDLEKMKADALQKYGIKVLKTSRALMEGQEAGQPLTDYGLTGKHLDRMKQALDRFIQDDASYVRSREEKKKSRKKLDRRIAENDQLLKKKLDRMMHLFRDTQKKFYNAYTGSRVAPEKEQPEPEQAGSSAEPAGSVPSGKPAEDPGSVPREAPA